MPTGVHDGIRGPAPTPSAIGKLINGHQPDPREPQVIPASKTRLPRGLAGWRAKELYRTFTEWLSQIGMLGTVDVHALVLACNEWAQGESLYQQYMCEPWKKDRFGILVLNPARRAAMDAFGAAEKIFKQFGIGSPAERSRMKTPQEKPKSRWSGLIS